MVERSRERRERAGGSEDGGWFWAGGWNERMKETRAGSARCPRVCMSCKQDIAALGRAASRHLAHDAVSVFCIGNMRGLCVRCRCHSTETPSSHSSHSASHSRPSAGALVSWLSASTSVSLSDSLCLFYGCLGDARVSCRQRSVPHLRR